MGKGEGEKLTGPKRGVPKTEKMKNNLYVVTISMKHNFLSLILRRRKPLFHPN